jgi:hypothetical protein
MAEDEYSAYLKKQSYDDLVSISCSIDKEAHADRYQMVLAELAGRDKRGEKPEANWSGNATLFLGVFFIFEFVMDLVMSRTGWKPIIHVALGIGCFITAWFSRKKRKDETPAA